MKTAILFLCLSVAGFGQSVQKSCIIASRHHHSMGEAWSSWRKPKPLDYVEGDFPSGMKFHAGLNDKLIQEIQEHNGKVVTLREGYALVGLEDARRQCTAWVSSSPPTTAAK